MTRPRILVAGHRRNVETPLGPQGACVVYEGYLGHLTSAGAVPLMVWPGDDEALDVLDDASGVLLVGGGDVHPQRFGSTVEGMAMDEQRDGFEIALVLRCRERGVPLLAMCRGAQVMNVALGGSLRLVEDHVRHDLSSPQHRVAVEQGTLLREIVDAAELDVNSFHRWAAGRLATGLRRSAVAPADVIEAIESSDRWFALGIQWHAELLDPEHSARLFSAFVGAAKEAVAA